MLKKWYLIAVVLVGFVLSGNCLNCDDPSEMTAGVCTNILNTLEKALLLDEDNLFRMRQAFFYSPTASPVLLKVVYNITYGENIMAAVAEGKLHQCNNSSIAYQSQFEEKHFTTVCMAPDDSHCSRSAENSILKTQFEKERNTFSSLIPTLTQELKQRSYIYGWTSTGVYTVFHPMALHIMQVQIPFAILKLIHWILNFNQRSSETDTFLWDGSYELPTLYLDLQITTLSCAPPEDLLKSVLMNFNTLLNVYAAQKGELEFGSTSRYIGFTLPSTHVTASEIPFSNAIMINLYSLFFLGWYVSTLIIFYIWYNRIHSEFNNQQINRLHTWIENSESLISGMIMAAAVTGIIDGSARIYYSFIWTINIGWGAFLAVWLPHILFHPLVGILVTIACICHCNQYNNRFTHGYLIFPLHCFATALLQMVIPAIILKLVYPTQMTVIMIFVPTYLFTITTVTTIIIKMFQLNMFRLQRNAAAEEARENMSQRWLCYFGLFAIIITATLITMCIVLTLIYSELIGIKTGQSLVFSVMLSNILKDLSLAIAKVII